MTSSTEAPERADFTLEISFRYFPGGGREAALLEATLQNGAKFVFDVKQLSGKLGANLQLFYDATKAANSPSGTQNALTAPPPEWDESLVKHVAPGIAYGVNPQYDKDRRAAAKRKAAREVQDVLDELEITL